MQTMQRFTVLALIAFCAVGGEAKEVRPAATVDVRLSEAQREMEVGKKFFDTGRYEEAVSHVEHALALREGILGKNHLAVAECLVLLGRIARLQANYARAEQLYRRALLIRETILGASHPDVAESLKYLGVLYKFQGLYSLAESLFLRSLQVNETAFGSNHPSVANILIDMSFLYFEKGQWRQAESFAERAIKIYEAYGGVNFDKIAYACNSLSLLAYDQGDLTRAIRMQERALKIRKVALGSMHPLVAQNFNNLARFYMYAGEYDQALQFNKRAIAIWRSVFGSKHPQLAEATAVLAEIYVRKGLYRDGQRLYKAAIKAEEEILGLNHLQLADSLHDLACLYLRQRRYRDAILLYQRSLEIREMAQAPAPITESLSGIARLRLALHQPHEALPLLERAFAISEAIVRKDALYFPDSRLDKFLSRLHDEEELLFALLRTSSSVPRIRRLALASAILRKGRSTEEVADITRSIYRDLDAADREKFEQLRTLRAQLAALSLAPPAVPREERRQRLQSLENEAEAIETDLARRSAPLRELTNLPHPADIVDRVAAVLPKDGALLEIVAFEDVPIVPPLKNPPNEGPHLRRYLALVLLPDGTTQALDLGLAAPIDAAVASLRTALNTPDLAYQPAAEALYRLVFRPIAPLLGTQRRLFISPDGQLNLVPFGALHDGTRFLADAFDWVYLTSGKDLLRRHEAPSRPQSIVVFADPDFNASPLPVEAASTPAQGDVLRSATLERFFAVPRAGYFDHAWVPLSDARREAEAVQRLFPQARLLLGAMATKQALLSFPSPGILHIATHGFFIEDSGGGTDSAAPGRGKVFGGSASPRGPIEVSDPLLRSGIILAGANPLSEKNQANPSRFEASVATSLELAGMNLWGTQLVVLSACDTGRGEIKLGQGVYGLRRALTIAGAETLVTSLWQVDDETTAMLMSDFYQGLRDGQGRAEALRNAMQALRKTHPHPYYWAPFILIGNDAPLRGLTP